MGDIENGIIKQSIRDRKPIPDKILNAPVLFEGCLFYWLAFLMLSSERVSEGSIPWRAMRSYASEYGIRDVDEREEFCMVIRELDLKFLKLQSKSSSSKNKSPGGDKSASGPRRLKPRRK